jgi:predicted nuclease with TOPRIM domain
MAKKKTKNALKKTKNAPQTNTDLALSSFHLRFDELQKDHQWLLKQIQRKRKELNNFLEQMREIAVEIMQRTQPFHEQLIELDREIHALFAEIFETRKFGKKTHKEVKGIYRRLQMSGLISPQDLDNSKDEDDADGDTDAEKSDKDAEDDDFNFDFDGDYFNNRNNPPPDHEKSKASGDLKQMRRTFLRLAEVFHPDKVTNQENQEHYTEVMKEINRAYEEGDLARLLEIERHYQVGESFDLANGSISEIERQCARLEQDNQLLANQYENLKSELRWMRRTAEGEMVKSYRAIVKEGLDPIDQMVADAERHIAELSKVRTFVKDFRDKKMTIKEFLDGPVSDHQSIEDRLEELMQRALEELGITIIRND